MPNRYIRESAIESEAVNALSWRGEVFYRRLLNRADDFGRFTANLALLRASLFPLQLEKVSEKDIAELLKECEGIGLIATYDAEGKKFLALAKWEQGRAKESRYPQPSEDVCKRLQTYVYKRKQKSADVPDSDSDSDSDSDITPDKSGEGEKPDGKKPRKERKPVERNPIIDALVESCGGEIATTTRPAWVQAATALRDIKEVSPVVTVEDIKAKAAAYRKAHPEWNLTPLALAKHWGSLVERKQGTLMDEFDWRQSL